VVEDPRLLVSAIEPGEGASISARLWNASGESVESEVELAGRAPREVDLAGRGEAGTEAAPSVRLRPWQIATLRI
jgi:hypothetical protein